MSNGMYDFSSGFGVINTALANLGKQNERAWQMRTLADLGKQAQGGDYAGAARAAFAAGDAAMGMGLLKIARDAKQESDWLTANAGLFGGTPAKLINSESGGNWRAQNDAVGAGGAVGHFGRAQFGQARLQEAAAAGAIPPGTTPQQFIASPQLQQAAEAWHFGDIDQSIRANGFDRLVGQQINGVPITLDGLRAVAHLGGKGGMRRFIKTGGRYNPSDANGTSLMDYLARHGSVRTAGADMPASGATPAAMETGQPGFAVPQAPSMSAGIFNQITGALGTPVDPATIAADPSMSATMVQARPLDPSFVAEGLSQPWMGTALQRRGGGAQMVQAQTPPQRSADLPNIPAAGAVQTIGQMPVGQQFPPDLSNAPDAGSRTFAASQAAAQSPRQGIVAQPVAQQAPQAGIPAPAAPAAQPPAQADVPAQNAASAQGFVVPPGGAGADASIANDPRVMNLQRALAGAPERFKPSIQSRLNILVEELKAQRQQNAPTDVQRNYNLAKQQGYTGTLLDYQKELRAQTNVNVKNEPPPQTGYRYIRDANGNIERAEPIPGSKAAQDAEAAAEKKQRADRIKAEVGTTVGNALDDIDRLMAGATLWTTGGLGARVASIPGTAAYDIAQALKTVGANISFAQLQQMREASPTGGALGAVSDSEQQLLQNSYAALSQSQSDAQFKTNLGRVRAIFERIVHGRTLSSQERKTGGPMTMERAKGLREEAAAAIASGAPRDAVLKRLKEDYGIPMDGL